MTSDRAACADHLNLVDAATDHPSSPAADQLKRLCRHCPIARDCLTTAMESPKHEWGIWGATSSYERTLHGAQPAPGSAKAATQKAAGRPITTHRAPCGTCGKTHQGNCRIKDLRARIQQLTA